MQNKILYYVFLAIVFIGLVDAIYLSISVYLAIAPVCGSLQGCDFVSQSPYSRLRGIPLAYMGVAYYMLCAILSGLLLSDSRGRLLILVYTIIGALASVIFIYVQVALIHALCLYCLISALVTFVLLAIAIAVFLKK